jgi:hypothetical protein
VCVCVWVGVGVCVCVCVFVCGVRMYIICVRMNTYIYTHLYKCTHMCTYKHTCIHAHAYRYGSPVAPLSLGLDFHRSQLSIKCSQVHFMCC